MVAADTESANGKRPVEDDEAGPSKRVRMHPDSSWKQGDRVFQLPISLQVQGGRTVPERP